MCVWVFMCVCGCVWERRVDRQTERERKSEREVDRERVICQSVKSV